jgi:hypothetical protein
MTILGGCWGERSTRFGYAQGRYPTLCKKAKDGTPGVVVIRRERLLWLNEAGGCGCAGDKQVLRLRSSQSARATSLRMTFFWVGGGRAVARVTLLRMTILGGCCGERSTRSAALRAIPHPSQRCEGWATRGCGGDGGKQILRFAKDDNQRGTEAAGCGVERAGRLWWCGR